MPMIIRVLEHLEFFASNAEKGTEELEDLRFEVKKMRCKEEEKALEKQRLDKVCPSECLAVLYINFICLSLAGDLS